MGVVKLIAKDKKNLTSALTKLKLSLKKYECFLILRPIYRKTYNKLYKLYFYFQRLKNKQIIKENLKNKVFAVDIFSQMGIGANLVWALEIMAYCNETGLTPQIKFTHPESKEKEDYFGNYFEIRSSSISIKKNDFAKMRNFNDLNLNFTWDYNDKLNLELADRLIKKYLSIKTNISDEVDKFQSQHFNMKNVLGVHYRGTDKKSEAKQITFGATERNINLYLTKYPETNCIFISSDDKNFINYIENSSIPCPIVYYNDSFRSSNNLPIHTANNNLSEINKDALINCLLLSKCNTLMKTASALSDWSLLFNPNLQLILLSKPYENYRFFPGKEFYTSVLFDPIT
jgi:hypothetical protein